MRRPAGGRPPRGTGGAGGVDAWPPESAAALLTVWGGTRRGLAGHATTGRTPWFRVCKSGDGVVARCRRPRHGAGSQPGQIGWRLGGGGPRAATGWERTRTERPRSCAAPTVRRAMERLLAAAPQRAGGRRPPPRRTSNAAPEPGSETAGRATGLPAPPRSHLDPKMAMAVRPSSNRTSPGCPSLRSS